MRLADYLLAGVSGKEGILGVGEGSRVRTFRGKKMIEFMLHPKTKRKFGLEHVTNEEQAMQLADKLLNYTPVLFIPCERLKVRPWPHLTRTTAFALSLPGAPSRGHDPMPFAYFYTALPRPLGQNGGIPRFQTH